VHFGVDSDGDGATDHSVIGIGYDLLTRQYAIYDTWDTTVHWYEFQAVNTMDPWGIGRATFVEVA
ncbi:MAG: hypothetical protein KAX78_06660, partial [Phycisphaerae bacterium]|nr:hypothetical protein [Phycisphaerae bacterium]